MKNETGVSRQKPFPYVVVFTIIPVAANLVAVGASFLLNDLVYLEEERQRFTEFTVAAPWALWIFNAAPFPVIMGVVYAYLWPLFTALKQFDATAVIPGLAARRLLNAPIVISAFGVGGWILGTSFAVSLQLFLIREVTGRGLLVTVGNAVSLGGITFVFSYYALDYVNRRHVIPRYLAGRDLSEIPGVLRPSVQVRFFILLFSITALPLLIATQMLARAVLAGGSAITAPVYLVPLSMLLVGIILSWLLARAFGSPLIEMKTAVAAVRGGALQVQLNATSTDELGLLAEGINHMAQGLREKEFMKETFGKVVAPAVRDHLLKGNLRLGGETRRATVLFCDLRGFTSLSERLAPAQVVEMLNIHFDTMSRCIEAEGGLINKFIGDAIMAIYNVPLAQEDHATRAYHSARQMLASLAAMNAGFAARSLPELSIGIGIHTGEVLAGNIGSASRLEYTVIGDTVNVASRIEGLCKEAGVPLLISEATTAYIDQSAALRELGDFSVRGRERPIKLFTAHTGSPSP